MVVLLAVAGLVLGPWLAVVAARLAARDRAARPSGVALVVTSVLAAAALPGAVWVTGSRPATAALVWLAGCALVLASTDLAAHRLPDVVTVPAYAVCAAALVADAALLGTWGALLRSVLACAVAFAGGVLAAAVSPQGLGFGDVKLLGLLGLVLGWAGWDVLMACVFVGLLWGPGSRWCCWPPAGWAGGPRSRSARRCWSARRSPSPLPGRCPCRERGGPDPHGTIQACCAG